MLRSHQARGPQLLNLCYRAQEPRAPSKRRRRLSTATKSSLHPPQPEMSPHSSKGPAEPKSHTETNKVTCINKITYVNKITNINKIAYVNK